jgi:hypothetical protein
MKYAALILLAFIATIAFAHAYTDQSLTVTVSINPDGTAHVSEKTVFYVDTDAEAQAFKDNLKLGKSTILAWKKFSDNINYHIGGNQTAVDNLTITAGPEYELAQNARSVTLDYDLVGQFMATEKVGSRTVRSTLSTDVLGFDKSDAGQTILGSNVYFIIMLPQGAVVDKNNGAPQIAPYPYTYDSVNRTITWSGPSTGKWELVYDLESPLSNEVYSYFSDTYQEAIDYLPVGLLILSAAIIIFMLVKMKRN